MRSSYDNGQFSPRRQGDNMNILQCVLALCAFLSAIDVSCGAETTLQAVHVFFRHGHRNPTSLYPTDPNDKYSFLEGLGHITKQGRQEQLALGRYLRKIYGDFLSYNPLEVKARSSGRDRCLESMEANLAGLYPQEGEYTWDESVVIQPIPISTMPVELDVMLYEEAKCRKADNLYEYIIKRTREGRNIMSEYKTFLAFLEEKSGKKMTSWVSVRDLLDTITIEKEAGLKVPDWATSDVLSKMAEVAKYTTIVHYSNKEYNKFKAGLLLYDMRTNMNKIAALEGENKDTKIWMYASHDVLVAAFLSVFGQFNNLAVPPATAVGVELYKPCQGNFTVKMWFKNETDSDAMPVAWCGNGKTECSLDTFIRLTNEYTLDGTRYRTQCLERPLPDGVKMYGDY